MKTKVFLILLCISMFFISCKNETSKTKEPEQELANDFFKVTLDVKVKKTDDFQIYYIENADENFSEEKSIWINVKGSENQQKVVFDLPKDIVPHLIRLDFGLSDTQEDITLYSIEMNYFGKKFLINKNMFETYFRPLAQTQFDFNTGVLKPTFKDGKRVESVLHPHEVILAPEIDKLTK